MYELLFKLVRHTPEGITDIKASTGLSIKEDTLHTIGTRTRINGQIDLFLQELSVRTYPVDGTNVEQRYIDCLKTLKIDDLVSVRQDNDTLIIRIRPRNIS